MTASKNSNSRFVFDVDSTIWPAEKEYDRAAMKLYGKKFYNSNYDWYDVPDLIARYGPNYSRIFEEALGPRSFKDRKVYPGVVEAVQEIADGGYEIVFFTLQYAPEQLRPHLKRWLKRTFDRDFILHVHQHSTRKMPKILRSNSVALVDDKAETLKEALDAGLYAIAKAHPWNVQLLTVTPQIRSFEDWSEVVPILRKDGML